MLGPNYKLLALLGEGAMGKVYLAENLKVGRKEAIKVLKPELAKDDRFAARFRREARANSRLYHPNIVRIYDAGALPGGKLFMAMEYVDGAPLESLINDEDLGLPAERALTLVCQLASAVEHAHSRGVVHRDLKPANLMVVERKNKGDRLKVLDFGVAKIISPDYQESLRVSQEGVVYGTPLYMAPEQFYEKSNDARSDIYSIGCIAFELLTGMPPFTGKVSEIVVAHTDKPPPLPSHYADDITPELEEVVLKCLEKNPNNRYQTAGDVLAALVPLHPDYREDVHSDGQISVPDLQPLELYQTGRIKISDVLASAAAEAEFNQVEESASEAATEKQASLSLDALGKHWFSTAHMPHEHRHDIEDALRDLGELLTTLKLSDLYATELSATLSEVRMLEEELQRCAAERRGMEQLRRETDESARTRRKQLSFAIRELELERRAQTSGSEPSASEPAMVPPPASITGPITGPTARPITGPTTRPATGPMPGPTTRPITGPTTRPITGPTTRPATAPTAEMDSASSRSDLDFQIATLSKRLRDVGQEDSVVLARLEHQEEEQAVRRNRLKDGKRAAYGRLAQIVDLAAPSHENELGSLLFHYRQLCASVVGQK